MSYHVRVLTGDDRAASWGLGSLAFGYRDSPMPEDWNGPMLAGMRTWGAFDDSGRLIAKAADREQGQWFGGRIVPTSGVAGVAVVPDARRQGLARTLLTRLLADARDRGAVISTLFPTTPFLYRALGWEEVGALTYTSLPTTALAAVRAPASTTLRQATEKDVPAIYEIYRSIARSGGGLMERSGPLFGATPAELIADFHGITLAVGAAGAIEGYASWDRGPGYDETGKITVFDLMGLTPDATAGLLSMLGGWASVAPTTVLRLPDADPALLMIDAVGAKVEKRQPWMLRMVDAAGAMAARGWPPCLAGSVNLEVVDGACPWNAGTHRLVLESGEGRLEPGGGGDVRVTERGLSLLYAGAADPALLRRAGMLSGGEDRDQEFLRIAFAGPRPALLDYF